MRIYPEGCTDREAGQINRAGFEAETQAGDPAARWERAMGDWEKAFYDRARLCQAFDDGATETVDPEAFYAGCFEDSETSESRPNGSFLAWPLPRLLFEVFLCVLILRGAFALASDLVFLFSHLR